MNLLYESKYAIRLLGRAPAYTALSLLIVTFTVAILLIVEHERQPRFDTPCGDVADSGVGENATQFRVHAEIGDGCDKQTCNTAGNTHEKRFYGSLPDQLQARRASRWDDQDLYRIL